MPFITPLRSLITLFLAALGVLMTSALLTAPDSQYEATLSLSPTELVVLKDAPVTLDVTLSATTPVNAFSGEIVFDSTLFTVERISYNTDLADLWVTEPWYSKADNTIYFAGGTTRPGGFVGNENLLTVELSARATGQSIITIDDARVLKHDGLGTDASVTPSIDSIIASIEAEVPRENIQTQAAQVSVLTLTDPRDVTGDGKVSLADAATLMLYLGSENPAYDLNGDGRVSLADISIITAP